MSRSVRDKLWNRWVPTPEPRYIVRLPIPAMTEFPYEPPQDVIYSATDPDQTWGTKLQAARVAVMEKTENPDIFETLVLEDGSAETFDPDVQDFLKGLI